MITVSTPKTSPTQINIDLRNLAKDATVALIIQVGGIIINYILQIALARWMGKTEFGIYQYVTAWSLLFGILAALGLPRTVIRLVSEYKVKKDWEHLQGLVRGSWLLTVCAGLLICLISGSFILLFNHYHSFIYATPLLVGLGLVPLQGLAELQLATARAMEDIPLAYVPSQILLPILVLGGGFLLLERNHSLTSIPMITVATLMLLGVALFQLLLLWNKFNKEVEIAKPVYAYRQWLSISLVLLAQQAFMIILNQTDIIMVGMFLGPTDTGIYTVAVKTAMWVSFILPVVNTVSAPAFAILYTQKDTQGLQHVVSSMALWIFCPSVTIALVLLVFSQPILSIFGTDFMAASWSLKVIVLGQLINALYGSVGCLVTMTGHQNKAIPIILYCILINIVLNGVAIPTLGIVGAAITTTFTTIIWNIWFTVLVVKEIGVRPSVFYSFFGYKKDANLE
jgi:O-antigen/teichoic acid export membrane protein